MTSLPRAVALTVISGLFVLAGIFVMTVVGDAGTGLVAVVFFGACLLVGLVQIGSLSRGGDGEVTGPFGLLVMALASFVMGVGCLILLLLAVTDPGTIASPARSPLVAAIIGAIGTVFFGGGSGLIAVKAIVAARRR